MKILHINETVDTGGAAISMFRLHQALSRAGHESGILAASGSTRSGVSLLRSQSLLSRLTYHGLNLLGLNYAGIMGARRIFGHPRFQQADVIHLHNIHGGYFNYLWLPRLTRRKPTVWTLHDMWGLTGHCGYSLDCERWRRGCGRCPYLRTYPPVRRDATRMDWRLKRRVYGRSRMTLVCPSRWLADLASHSTLAGLPIRNVPHGVDTDLYGPRDRTACRESLGIDAGRLTILFVAQSLDNPYKHYALLPEALDKLPAALRERCLLLTMGRDGTTADTPTGVQVKSLGYVHDEDTKATAYAAADVFAFPTRADNQPLVLLEAMACGCPTVSVSIGGVPEVVRHGETGYVADAGNAEDFARGLERLLSDANHRERLAANCRRVATAEHRIEQQASRTATVYKETIRAYREDRS